MIGVIPLFGPVGPEMLIILLILVLLFGANRIPKLARSTGQAVTEFQQGREEIEAELEQADSESRKEETGAAGTVETETAENRS